MNLRTFRSAGAFVFASTVAVAISASAQMACTTNDGTADGGSCVDVDPATYDRTCSQDSDCTVITTGTFCDGQTCTCGPTAAINVNGLARYQGELSSLSLHNVCDCRFGGTAHCAAGMCQLCLSRTGCDAGAPSDGGTGDGSAAEAGHTRPLRGE